jgi:hypothetical protein
VRVAVHDDAVAFQGYRRRTLMLMYRQKPNRRRSLEA